MTVAEPVKTVVSVLRAEKLARSALRELDEERELTSADAGTFARLQTRARVLAVQPRMVSGL